MKKFFVYLFCVVTIAFISACSEDPVTNNTSVDELQNLKGTTWVLESYSYSIDQVITQAASGSTTTTEIPLTQSTTTIEFKKDGTFTITYEDRYLPAWDSIYVDSGTTTYSDQHANVAGGAFTGYATNLTDGVSRRVYSGQWKRVKVAENSPNVETYTYSYFVKILRTETNNLTVDDTQAIYFASNTDVDIQIFNDDDASWFQGFQLTNKSVSGKTDGTELYFTMQSYLGTFDSGAYTKQ